MKKCRGRKALMLFRVDESLERVEMIHREWESWMVDMDNGRERGGGR